MSFLRFGKGTLGYDSVDDLPNEAPHGTTANIVSPTSTTSSIYTYNGYLKLWVLSSSGSGGDTILSTSLAGTTLNIVTDATTWTTDLSSLVSAGGVGGAGVANQIAFWASTVVLDGDNDLTWDNATKILNVSDGGDPTLQINPVTGDYAMGDINFLTATPQSLYMSTAANYASLGGTSYFFIDSSSSTISIGTNNVNRITIQNTFTALEPYGTLTGETYELRFKQLISVSGYYIGFKAPDSRTSSTNLILKLPPNDPTAGQVMAFTAPVSGVSTGSWFSAGSGITGSGAANEVTYWTSATNIDGDPGLVYLDATNRLGVGGIAAPTSTIEAYDNTYPSTLPYITNNGVAITLNNTTGSSVVTSHYSTAGGSNSSVLDFLPDIAQYPDIGLRFVRYNVLGANDAFMQLFSTSIGYSILEGTLGIGFLLTTTGSSVNAPVMIGPDRIPKVYFYTDHFEMKPHGTSAGNTYEERFLELAANGTNYFATKAADNIATTRTMIWPNDDPVAGEVLSVTSYAGALITTEWAAGGGGGSGNIDGGSALTVYGGTSPVDGGGA